MVPVLFRIVSASLLVAGVMAASEAAKLSDVVVATAPVDQLADPADRIAWSEQPYPQFAAGSVAYAGAWLGDGKPAGAHGVVLSGPDGRLHFADGTPARFWGTTLCYGATFPEKPEEIEQLADSIAGMGYNLVRCHHNDSPWGGVGYMAQVDKSGNKKGSAIELDPQQIDRYDRLVAALIKRGVYLYVDMVDSRGWTDELGLDGWQDLAKLDNGNFGWKGVWPMPPMVAAWKRAATALLTHVNPYTGHSLASEPAVVCVEIINENGTFWDWGHKTTPAVKAWFDAEWNRWLLAKHGSRAGLVKAWTDETGTCGLFDDEDPAAGTVYRPQLIKIDEWDRSNRSKARGACRFNDHSAFLAALNTGFYKEASAHLRTLGFKAQIVGSHELKGPLNQQSEVDGTGSLSAHLYGSSRMAWGARPGVSGVTVTGVDVRSNNWFMNIPRVKVVGAPSWNGEWTAGSLSYRADSNLVIAAMSAFQRIDGSLHFGFSGRWSGTPQLTKDTQYDWHEWEKSFGLSYTAIHDAPWMAINRVCAALLRRADIPRSRYRVQIALSAEDVAEQNLHALGLDGGSGTVGGAALFLPLLHEVETAFFDQAYIGDADVVFTTGRTASGDYRKAKHALVLGDNPWSDRFHQKRDLAAPARLLHPALKSAPLTQPTTFTIAFGYSADKSADKSADQPRTVTMPQLECALEISSLPKGSTPIGVSADGRWALGWCDDRDLVLPAAGDLQRLGGDPRWLYRFYLAAAARWQLDLAGNRADAAEYISDNRAITTDWGTGSQLIDTACTQAAAGFIGYRPLNRTTNLDIRVEAPYAVVALTSTDAKPLAQSRRMLLVACGRVSNTGTEYTARPDGGVAFTKTGDAPLLIEGLRGQVALHDLADNTLEVYALDAEGRRLGQLPVERTAGGLSFALSPRWRTQWFEIVAPGTAAPVAPAGATWPGEEQPRTVAAAKPTTLRVADYLALLAKPAAAAVPTAPVVAIGGVRLPLTDPATWKAFQGYANLKVIATTLALPIGDPQPALELQIGQITRDWNGGMWFNITPPPGLQAADCSGLAFRFQGDGTLPREVYLSVSGKGADGKELKAKSRNLNQLFESTDCRDVVLTAADFPGATVDFSHLTRIDFAIVGTLMDNRYVGKVGAFQLVTASAAGSGETHVANLDGRLPAPLPLAKAELTIPWIAAELTADGDPAEALWKQSVGVAMDEDAVPAWQKVGSFVADGNRKLGEKARFWLVATPAGLALIADIDKGGGPPLNSRPDWWQGDCVELFTDAALARGKPTKQLFFAYQRPTLDRAVSSAPNARVGRVRTPRGYALEALVPWGDLGVVGKPGASFGLEIQVDIGNVEGRRLQLCLGTGTNEAWVTAERYLTIHIANP